MANKLYIAKYIIKINRVEHPQEHGISAENKKEAAEAVRKYAQQKFGRHAFRIELKEAK